MKIICKKGCSVKSALQIVSEYIEKKGLEYPLISGDLEIEISLKNQKGEDKGKFIKQFWDIINNRKKVNVNILLPFRNCVPTENEPINMHSQCIKTRSGYFPHIEIYT